MLVSVSVPPTVESWVSPVVAAPSLIAPEKIDEGPTLVRVAAVGPLLVTVPPPESEATV